MRVAVAVIALLALTACSSSSSGTALPSGPFQKCPAAAPAASGSLPTLRCFGSDTDVSLAHLGKPAIVNLWASWCDPCRTELPHLQAFADRAGGQVLVLGVVTKDDPEAAAALATDLKITFPAVFDGDGTLLANLGRNALPITLLLAPDGTVVSRYEGPALTEAGVADLARRYLGVAVQ